MSTAIIMGINYLGLAIAIMIAHFNPYTVRPRQEMMINIKLNNYSQASFYLGFLIITAIIEVVVGKISAYAILETSYEFYLNITTIDS